jgi:DnaJ-class molecular chaperone
MRANVPTHYQTLGLAPQAAPALVRKAYRQLAQKHHPDKQLANRAQAQQRMAQINEAYAVLSDPVRRASYDRWVQAHQARLAAECAVRAAQPTGFSAAWPWYLLFATMSFTSAAVGTVAYTAAVPPVAAPLHPALPRAAVKADAKRAPAQTTHATSAVPH